MMSVDYRGPWRSRMYTARPIDGLNFRVEEPMRMPTKQFLTRILAPMLLATLLLPIASHAGALEDALDRKELRVGVSLFAPWVMRDGSGELTGFEIEVARKLAAEMSVKPVFKVYPWADIMKALNAGEIDVIIAGMAITPRRALQVEFSDAYAESGVALLTNTALTKDFDSLEELDASGNRIVAVAKTLGADVAELVFDEAELLIVDNTQAAADAVTSDAAHAYVVSEIEASFLVRKHPDVVDMPLDKPMLTSVAGMAVKRGEQGLLNFLDAWIAARTADKWLSTTHKYWFKTLDWLGKVKP